MILSFADKDTEQLFGRRGVRRFQKFERVALRKLVALDAATTFTDLKGPGYSLESLKHDRKGQHSIRINSQWRVCFFWDNGNARDVEITDYH
ncbi:MAG: type II toxin-antitoxin system RelE/ParE family toxin [Candidatus Eremiobacteraeota bacterium]|nr:type II toxin-antitoxin system RelE/ParE family toxin [Candidatus Eremiobacteraeota bacterium]MBC5804579.1 type II toxin-antitoxin system RelE/ParE family toxin [Candidatus Eremiobacteraeota bacterium]MBC5822791.1 type II toxin-antitoxin system RelE/ParE family toxin [Candidatus Eremiobacteraeota bacterium]